jgi:hypothetical protein
MHADLTCRLPLLVIQQTRFPELEAPIDRERREMAVAVSEQTSQDRRSSSAARVSSPPASPALAARYALPPAPLPTITVSPMAYYTPAPGTCMRGRLRSPCSHTWRSHVTSVAHRCCVTAACRIAATPLRDVVVGTDRAHAVTGRVGLACARSVACAGARAVAVADAHAAAVSDACTITFSVRIRVHCRCQQFLQCARRWLRSRSANTVRLRQHASWCVGVRLAC